MTQNVGSIRAQNRERITTAILASARQQIAEVGAAGLSLRAIARELGMASSALYRYFPSRDALLTKLIIDSYNALGEAAESGNASVPGADAPTRFRIVCNAVRDWALANRHEFFLIYGTPVAGYAAPQDTIEPATRVANLLIPLFAQAPASSAASGGSEEIELSHREEVAEAIAPVAANLPVAVATELLVVGVGSFSAMFGAISFELSGQLQNVVTDSPQSRHAYYNALIDIWLCNLGW